SKTAESCRHRRFVTVVVEQRFSHATIYPYCPQFCIRLATALVPVGVNHFPPLIHQAESRRRDYGAHVHKMPHRASSRDQSASGSSQRVGDNDYISVATIKGSANQTGVGP